MGYPHYICPQEEITDIAWRIHEQWLKEKEFIGDLIFITMALVGEAGELANLVKKRMRGDNISADEIDKEIADIYIYLLLLVRSRGMDINAVAASKLIEVEQRYATTTNL